MRRFSQRSSLVTLSEINITPLLDLAFVLLIIFIITTPLLEKGIDLKLPKADGKADPKLDKHDIKTVEINAQGMYFMNSRPMKLEQIVGQLVQDHKYNPNIVVYIRGDGESRLKQVVAVMDACSQNGISRYSVRTEPLRGR
jgi:biopolymer transport protein ExbD